MPKDTTRTSSIQEGVDRIKDEAKEGGASALAAVKEGAQALGEEARGRVEDYAEGGKEVVRKHLDDFASAVRRASDELSENDQTLASQFVRQAAGGLESLSRSVDNTSFGDLVDSVRSFGRRNPAAFIGGAVLAGLALGRFVRASGRHSDWDDGDDDWRSGGGSSYPQRDENGRFRPRSDWQSGSGASSPGSRGYAAGSSSDRGASFDSNIGGGIGSSMNSTGEAT